MLTSTVNIKGKNYQVKFGLGSLINLSQIPNIDVGDSMVLYEGLKTLQPGIDLNLLLSLNSDEKREAKEVVSKLFSPNDLPSPQTIEDWYRRGIGEVGLSYSDFYCLTPYELDLIYEGYQQRLADCGNLMVVAIRKAMDDTAEPFELIQQVSREETFKHLNIKEE